MSSYVEIANSAALTVGTSARLTSPDDDTVLGRAVAAKWDIERRAALREGSWNFATKRANLPQLTEVPVNGYSNAFQLPTDCLKLIEVQGYARARYQLEGRRILCDAEAPLSIRYLADIEEPAQFDDLFANAFALRLACAIGNRIAGSAFKEADNWQKYQQALAEAKHSDAMENPPIRQEESDWVLARERGSTVDLNYIDGSGY